MIKGVKHPYMTVLNTLEIEYRIPLKELVLIIYYKPFKSIILW